MVGSSVKYLMDMEYQGSREVKPCNNKILFEARLADADKKLQRDTQ